MPRNLSLAIAFLFPSYANGFYVRDAYLQAITTALELSYLLNPPKPPLLSIVIDSRRLHQHPYLRIFAGEISSSPLNYTKSR